MLNRLVVIALKNRMWVLGTTLALILIGAFSLKELPIDAVPDITNIQVMINTKTDALDPEKIEMLVTRPIETEVAGLGGLEEVRSISRYGLSQVTLVFSEGTDIYWARQQVTERLQSAKKELPSQLTPELAPITTGLGEVYMYSVEAIPGSRLDRLSEEAKLTELRSIQDFLIRPVLRRISGVADVDSNGGFKKEIHINFFPDRLEKVGLTVEQLSTRLETLGENFGGGYIQQDNQQIIVRTVPGFSRLEDLENIPLGLNVRGAPILLKEVAQVREDHALRLGAATRDGKETVLGTVLMRLGANSRQVAVDAETTLQSIKIPEGVRAVQLYSRSYLVDSTIGTVKASLMEGAILVIAVLILLLGNFRAALIVACAIPLSMLAASRGMLTFGISGNLMSLGAIDFGLLVDGSVVMIESVIQRLNQNGTRLTSIEKQKLIMEASQDVIEPVVFGLLMIMAVYVPILTLQGIEGKMFRPMAATVLLAILASLLIAVFVMPVLADLLIPAISNQNSDHDTWLYKRIKGIYVPSIQHFMSYPKKALMPALGVLILGIALLFRLGSDFIPSLDEGDLVVGLTRDSKMGITASVQEQLKAENLIRRHPEVETVFSRLGTPESATDPMGVNLADTFVMLAKDHKRWSVPSKDQLFSVLRSELLKLNPDQEVSATQPIEMRFNEILEGSRADVTLRIFGMDLAGLLKSITEAKTLLEQVPGTDSVSFDPLTALKSSPMLDIAPNFSAQARYGITLADLNRNVALSMGGREVGSYFELGRRLPVIIHLDESLRENPKIIEQLPIGLPQGGTLPLSKLAKITVQDRVTTIARSWSERYAAISINIKDRDIASFVRESQSKIASSLHLTPDMHLYWGGQFKNLNRARHRLFFIVPLTLAAVFLILLRNFNSLSKTLLVFSSIPFASVGGVYALWLRGIHFSVSAAVGFIALIGIALLNSLVLMSVLNRGRFESLAELKRFTIDAAVSRLRPVMMTAMVASLGFLPMALNTGIGAEVQKPLATVVIGGLITATALTLILLPLLFVWLETKKARWDDSHLA